MIKGHGDDRYQYGKSTRADFSSNVWFGGTTPELIAHLQKNMQMIERYPEPDAAGLCRKIAGYHEVNSNQVLAFNGSVEAFYTIALAFREAVSAILYPGFAEYEDACHLHNHKLSFFRKDEWQTSLNTRPSLFWFGNPNNPDGHIFEFQEIKHAIENFPETVFIIDEAYADFSPGFQSVIPLTKIFRNLIVVRSFTKCYAIPGLRLGYVVTSAPLAAKLSGFQQPWSVNVLAQEAGKFLIDTITENPVDAQKISNLSTELQQAINQLDGFRVLAANTSFFLIEMNSGPAAGLKQFLHDEHGILIRDASNFRGLDQKYFRVSTLSAEENQLLLVGLADWKTKFPENS